MPATGKVVLGLLAALAALQICLVATPVNGQDARIAAEQAKALSRAFRTAARRASPSVVTIIAKARVGPAAGSRDLRELLRDPRFRDLFPEGLPFEVPEPDGEQDEDGPGFRGPAGVASQIGSGVIIDADGIVLTNNHVVQDADDVVVRLADGRELSAADIKTDPLSDLATLRIQGAGRLPAAKLGDSDKIEIGDWVIAIGSPFELEATVSAGIISGKGRGIHQIVRGQLLQTDAAINPGNSGGPLVNLDGEVVGINTAIATSSGGYQGIGFAIPVNRARWVSRQLLSYGRVRRAFLGVRIDDLTPEVAQKLGRPARSGVRVVAVVPDGPADAAGIRKDDVIVEFAGRPIRRARELMDAVEQKPVDSRQRVTVFRNGTARTFEVLVKPLPAAAGQ